MSAVVVSYALFWLRGVWMIRAPANLQRRWVRIVPHVVDTLLLVSAITLAVSLRSYPLQTPWLTAKVAGLVTYIVLGTIALKRGRSLRTRIVAWIAAQAVFFYIVAVAVTKTPWPPG